MVQGLGFRVEGRKGGYRLRVWGWGFWYKCGHGADLLTCAVGAMLTALEQVASHWLGLAWFRGLSLSLRVLRYPKLEPKPTSPTPTTEPL